MSFQNWHEEFNEFWVEHSKISKICTLISCFWPKYIIFKLKNYGWVIFDGIEDWCNIWKKTNLCFQKWNEEFCEHSRLKNSDFILESKMVELNQNKNSEQPGQPNAV